MVTPFNVHGLFEQVTVEFRCSGRAENDSAREARESSCDRYVVRSNGA